MEDDADVTSSPGLADEAMDDFIDDDPGKESDLTGDGGVVKKVLHVGDGWETPSKGDEVTVHYVGTLENGEKFDSSRDRDEPFVFKLGTGNVIKGWDEGVKTMKKGEKAQLTCRADYAYGDQGSPPKIPPNATLNFEVELLSWKSIKDIAGNGGVIKTIQTEGSGWNKPSDKDEALVRYSVRVAGSNVRVASSSQDGEVVAVGSGRPLKAFPVALKTMKEGEKALLEIKPEYGYTGEGRPADLPPEAELEAELELVLIRKVEDASGDGKVLKKLIKKGEDYKRPNEGAAVKIAYIARVGGLDGLIFDERSQEKPLQFIVDSGDDNVVEGLDLAILKTNAKETVEVTIAPEYGYGDAEHRGSVGVVPPNSTLHYTVELLEVQKGKESWDMSPEEKLESAQQRKETGNAFFKAGKWERAIKKYKAAANAIDYDKDFPAEVKSQCSALKKSVHLNSAAASIKLNNWKEAVASANKVLQSDPSNVKALYRRAQAYLGLQEYVEAQVDIRAALQTEPNNKDVRALQARYKKEAAAANQRDAKMYKNIFDKLAKMPDRSASVDDKPEAKEEDAEMQTASEDENKAEAAHGVGSAQMNGHAESNGTAQQAAAEPMAVDAQA